MEQATKNSQFETNKREAEQHKILHLKKDLEKEFFNQQELINEVLSLNCEALLLKLKAGSLDKETVMKIFMLKALQAHTEYNCLTNIIDDAIKSAKDLHNLKNYLPLCALPVSLKECVGIKGHDATIGYSILIGQPHAEDSVIVKSLKHAGAVPFVRTNLPQSMMSFESSNPIYGETSNPFNKTMSPGGSSSGEGSLIGAGGSLLGIGTDIAGSIRVPSHFCGICGLKPTKNRLSAKGLQSAVAGQTAISSSIGPMARDVGTLVLAMQSLLTDFMFDLDKNVPPLPFNTSLYESKEKLRIGFYVDDGYVKASPACSRAVAIAQKQLEAAGHSLVEFVVPEITRAMELAAKGLFADGVETIRMKVSSDSVDKRIRHLCHNGGMPAFLRKIIAACIHLKYPRLAGAISAYAGCGSVGELWKLTAEIESYKSLFFNEWNRLGIDAIICPAYSIAACPKGGVSDLLAMMNYTVLYNLVNCPAGVITVTKVTEEDISQASVYNGHHNDPWDVHIKQMSQMNKGMPVGVQCVAKPWKEEICLRIMKEVENTA